MELRQVHDRGRVGEMFALVLAIISLVHSTLTARFSRRLLANDKKTDALQTLVEARLTVSQVRVQLMSLRQLLVQERPFSLPELESQIAEAQKLETQLDAEFDSVVAAPPDVLSMERHRQDAKVTLASVKKVVDGLAMAERALGASPKRGSDG